MSAREGGVTHVAFSGGAVSELLPRELSATAQGRTHPLRAPNLPLLGRTRKELTVDNEIQLISDGDGLAVLGDPTVVERFLDSEGLPSKDLGLQRLRPALGNVAGVVQAGSQVAGN